MQPSIAPRHYRDVASRCPETSTEGIERWLGSPSGKLCPCGAAMTQYELANGGCEKCKSEATFMHFNPDKARDDRRRSGVPASYCRMTWETWDGSRMRMPPAVAAFRFWTRDESYLPILLVRGVSNIGKTHIAAAMFDEVLRAGRIGRWLPAHQLNLDAFQDEAMMNYACAGILVIDDLRRRESFSYNRHERVWTLLEERQSQSRPTIITTNLGDEELREWGDGFYRRIVGGLVADLSLAAVQGSLMAAP